MVVTFAIHLPELIISREPLQRMKEPEHEGPEFLRYIKSNPRKAAELFYVYAVGKLRTAPPREMHGVPDNERADLIHDIVMHFLKDDMRVLRRYTPDNFEAWFYTISRRKVVDYWRERGRKPDLTRDADVSEDQVTENNPGPLMEDPAVRTELRDLLRKVNQYIHELDRKCRLLLRLAAREFPPLKIARILREPPENAKKISGQIGHCRKKLADLLSINGVDVSDFTKD